MRRKERKGDRGKGKEIKANGMKKRIAKEREYMEKEGKTRKGNEGEIREKRDWQGKKGRENGRRGE